MFDELIASLPKASEQDWHEEFLKSENADYYTWFMRLVTACKSKIN
jgi:hypothetical protein